MTNTRNTHSKLPHWDLKDLYTSPESETLKIDLAKARKDAAAFHKNYFGKIIKLSGNEIGDAIGSYENIDERLSRIMSYAQLLHSGDVTSPEISRFFQTTREAITEISAKLVFFILELNQIDDATLVKKLKSEKLAYYSTWIRDLRMFIPHELNEELNVSFMTSESLGQPLGSAYSMRPWLECVSRWTGNKKPWKSPSTAFPTVTASFAGNPQRLWVKNLKRMLIYLA